MVYQNRLLFIFLLTPILSYSMEQDDKGKNLYNTTHPSVILERSKSIALLVSADAQKRKFGMQKVDADTSIVLNQVLAERNIDNDTVSCLKMNDYTAQKFAGYGIYHFGVKDLLSNRIVWINESYLKKMNPEMQRYIIASGVTQTELLHPELKSAIIGESAVGIITWGLFRKAKELQAMQDASHIDKNKSSFFWYDLNNKSSYFNGSRRYIKPRLLRGAGWAIAFTAPLFILPNTSLEQRIMNKHKLSGITLMGEHPETIPSLMRVVKNAAFFNEDGVSFLPADEIDHIKGVLHNYEHKKQIQEKRALFNFYECIKDCKSLQQECKRRDNQSRYCFSDFSRCIQNCNYEVKSNPQAGLYKPKKEMELK